MFGDRLPTQFPVSTSPRTYQWAFKFYPDSTDYDWKELINLLKQFFNEWAWILHDKDLLEFKRDRLRVLVVSDLCKQSLLRSETGKTKLKGAFRNSDRRLFIPLAKPHIHFFGRNDVHCNISKQQIVKYLGLPYSYNHRPHDIEPIRSWGYLLKYTIHRNAPEKYQYDIKRVKTNIRGFSEIIAQKPTMNDDLKILYKMLEEARAKNETIPYYELVRRLTYKGCTIQFYRSRMVKDISESYQYYEMGCEVR